MGDLLTDEFKRNERLTAKVASETARADENERLIMVWYQRKNKAENRAEKLQQRIDKMTALITELTESRTYVDSEELKYQFDQI